MAHTERLGQLRENLVEYFSQEELHSLCFDLGVDWDRLRGEEKAGKVTALLTLLDNTGRIPEFIERCARLRPNVAWQEILRAAEAPSPFKGLQYFDVADADIFFGRELLTAKLVSHLAPHPAQGERFLARFLGIVGASGSGKSSVVRAGLVPALRRGEPLADGTLPPEGSTRWPVHVITPTHHPLESLAASLTRDSESVTATATLMDDLARDPRSLHLYVRKLLARDRADHLLLVVDQFEELFTACKDEALRRAFVGNLLYAVGAASPVAEATGEGWREAGDGPTLVVIALRADFYAHCAQYANLREALAQHQEFIGPMTADELRCAIQEPARRNGWEFESGLVDLMLRDVGNEPGALPLLSHALLETWKRRQGRTLTLAGYADCGGVRGAIARTADAVYNSLSPDQQQIARNIFMRLTELGEGTQDTRRRVALTELVPRDEDKPAIEAVVKLLADARLVTTAEEIAEVAHEALIREWPTLRQWLDENRASLRLHRDLTQASQDWASHAREASYLYRGARLAQAVETFGVSETPKVYATLNALEREFLDASKALAEHEQAEREAARQRELQAAQKLADEQRRRRQGLQRLAVALGVLLLVAIAAVMVASQQRNAALGAQATAVAEGARADRERDAALGAQATAVSEGQRAEQQRNVALNAQATAVAERGRAEAQSRIALSRQLATQAQLMLNSGNGMSLTYGILLEIESLKRSQTDDGNQVLRQGLTLLPRLAAKITQEDKVLNVAISADGRQVAAVGAGNKVQVFSTEDGNLAWQMALGSPVDDISFSPSSKWLAATSNNGVLWVCEVDSGQQVMQIKFENQAPLWAFSPDDKWLATARGKTIQILDVSSGRELKRIESGLLGNDVIFSPDGQRLAVVSSSMVQVWEVATGQIVTRWPTGDTQCGYIPPIITFMPGGNFSAGTWACEFDSLEGSYSLRFRKQTLSTTGQTTELISGFQHSLNSSCVLSKDWAGFMSKTEEGNSIAIWDKATGRELVRMPYIVDLEDLAFGVNKRWLVTTSYSLPAHRVIFEFDFCPLYAGRCQHIV